MLGETRQRLGTSSQGNEASAMNQAMLSGLVGGQQGGCSASREVSWISAQRGTKAAPQGTHQFTIPKGIWDRLKWHVFSWWGL